MNLGDYARRKYLPARDLSEDYVKQVETAVRLLEQWHGRPVDLKKVNDSLLNRWVADLMAQNGRGPKAINGIRACVLAVLRDAEVQIGRIKKAKETRKLPEAWSLEELRALLAASQQLPGLVSYTYIPRADWFPCLIELLYYTGIRLGDALQLQMGQLRGNSVAVVQSKTRFEIARQITPGLADRLQSLPRNTPAHVLPWPASRKSLFVWFRKAVEAAGIRPGTTRWIRRTAASYVERDRPGSGGRFLGHLSADLALKHYFDPRIIDPPINPPVL